MSDIALPDPPFAVETESTVRQRMLDAVDGSFNKDPGDIVFDMLTPAAIEIDRLYDAMEVFMGEAFIPVATGTYLDALGFQLVGVVRLSGEADTAYRARLMARLGAPVGAGNEADYKTWAQETGLVGFVSVIPVWEGAGTVQVLVATSDRAGLTTDNLAAVAAYIETKRPIGATVTVGSIATDQISLTIQISLRPGYVNDAALLAKVTTHLREYFATLGPSDDVLYNEIVRYVLEVDGVSDLSSLDIDGDNGSTSSNYTVNDDKIANLPSDGSTIDLSLT